MLLTTVPSWILQRPTRGDFGEMQKTALKIAVHEIEVYAMLQLTSVQAFNMFKKMLHAVGDIDDYDCGEANRWLCVVPDQNNSSATIQIIDPAFVSNGSARTVDVCPGLYVSAEISLFRDEETIETLITVFTWSQVESDTRLTSPWIRDRQELFALSLSDEEWRELLSSSYDRTTSVFSLMQTLAPENRCNLQKE